MILGNLREGEREGDGGRKEGKGKGSGGMDGGRGIQDGMNVGRGEEYEVVLPT